MTRLRQNSKNKYIHLSAPCFSFGKLCNDLWSTAARNNTLSMGSSPWHCYTLRTYLKKYEKKLTMRGFWRRNRLKFLLAHKAVRPKKCCGMTVVWQLLLFYTSNFLKITKHNKNSIFMISKKYISVNQLNVSHIYIEIFYIKRPSRLCVINWHAQIVYFLWIIFYMISHVKYVKNTILQTEFNTFICQYNHMKLWSRLMVFKLSILLHIYTFYIMFLM